MFLSLVFKFTDAKRNIKRGFTVNLSHWDNKEFGRTEFIKVFTEMRK
jgi:hypothetical protein